MPLPVEPKLEFHVLYKPKPNYVGSHHADLRPGTHAVCLSRADALMQAGKCKKYFNEENILIPNEDPAKNRINTVVHDNVIVWIDEYVDGVFQEPKGEKDRKVA